MSISLEEIVMLYKEGYSPLEISKSLGVSLGYVYVLLKRAELNVNEVSRRGHPRHNVNDAKHQEIKILLKSVLTYREIGDRYGVTKQRIQQIAKRFSDIPPRNRKSIAKD